jgi:outer membrane biosynthesis protein TonB
MIERSLARSLAVLATALLFSAPLMAQQTQTSGEKKCAFKIYKGNEVDKKVKILAKPEPEFTKEDRRTGASGEILLTAVFCGSAEVMQITVKSGLSDALDARAIEAARKIRFIPAEKDGQKVSQWLMLKYRVDL